MYKDIKDKIEYNKKYRIKNKEILNEYDKTYYLKNKEKKKEREKKRYLNNKEKIKKRVGEYYLKNKNKIKERDVKYYANNKEKILEYKKEYRHKNSERIKEYRLTHKENLRIYYNNKLANDELYRLSKNIRGLIRDSLKRRGYRKTSKTQNILGCTFEEFKIYLESKFEPWMNWSNYGNWNGNPNEINTSWDIDHIIPMSSATTEEEVIKLNHYTNLQPLCSYVNRYVKSGKINY